MTRSNFIGATVSAALAVLSCTASTAVIAKEQNSGALRGKHAATTSSIADLIPTDDIRRTTNPFEMAAQREESINHDHRELLTKRQQRKQQRQQELEAQQNSGGSTTTDSNNLNTGACEASRPQRCGCPNVFQADYRGSTSTTEMGFNCRAWTETSIENYPSEGLEGGAVCRNPNGVADRSWCFTDHEENIWDYCEIKTCGDDGSFNFEPVIRTGTTGNIVGTPGCVDVARYYEIDDDIAEIAAGIEDDADRVHFVGGVLRLAAHDFMDYDQNDAENPMGLDGCLDWTSSNNLGLSSIWNEHSPLFKLHQNKWSFISRPDFWVIAANAIVRQTSVDNSLDLFDTFYWGREEAETCVGSAERLPSTEGCRQVEGVFLERMGLKWKDAVALLGAHTVGRGHQEFSGHHGTWVPNDNQAQIFDKKYFEELVARAWSPRAASVDPPLMDWTTGKNTNKPKMMLNTDICLFYDVNEDTEEPCCTRTDMFDGNGNSRCESFENTACKEIDGDHPRWEAAAAVRKYLGGPTKNSDNDPFYQAFKLGWFKATMNGMSNLKPVMETC